MTEVRQLVRQADIVLLPSLWENCPYSCLEAMAAGRAVVCADQGGMPELIEDGVNGLRAAPGDAVSFVRRIEQLIEDPTLRARLGRSARATIERRHRDTDVARQALDVYQELVAGRSAAA
jgi:glycosyltransferase involved in cell wall biosynthesis